MNDLDQKLRDHYSSQSLSELKVEEILNSGEMVRPTFRRYSVKLAIAAILLIGSAIAGITLIKSSVPFEQIVAKSVLKNHLKLYEPEIFSSNYEKIQSMLPRLNFPISPTKPELLAGFVVEGGRYCSVHNELAAQIQLKENNTGKNCSLYIAPLTDELAEIDPAVFTYDTGMIQFWRDDHRLFVLAR